MSIGLTSVPNFVGWNLRSQRQDLEDTFERKSLLLFLLSSLSTEQGFKGIEKPALELNLHEPVLSVQVNTSFSAPSQSLDGDGVVFDDTEPDTKHSPRLTIITKYKTPRRLPDPAQPLMQPTLPGSLPTPDTTSVFPPASVNCFCQFYTKR